MHLEGDALIDGYCTAAGERGVPVSPDGIRCDMALSSLIMAFLYWHLYLHGNPPDRVAGIFEKMIADAHWLLDRQGTGAPEVFL